MTLEQIKEKLAEMRSRVSGLNSAKSVLERQARQIESEMPKVPVFTVRGGVAVEVDECGNIFFRRPDNYTQEVSMRVSDWPAFRAHMDALIPPEVSDAAE